MPEQLWAMEKESLEVMLQKTENATTGQMDQAQAMFGETSGGKRLIYSVEGDTATIVINGVLTKNPAPPIYRYFGIESTSYAEIIAAAREIKSNSSIEKVRVLYSTPGGMVDGVDEAYQEMLDLATSKEVVAEARGMMASAGYYLASPSSRIVSSAPNNEIGSIGVLVSYVSYKEMDEKYGVKEITVVSSNAPNKAASPESKEGLKVIQDRVNALERIFYMRVSEGRGVSVQDIAEKFGRGGVLVSYDPDSEKPDAVSAGMIDEVLGLHKQPKTEEKDMPNLAELMATDAGVRAEVEAKVAEAFKTGQQSGKDSATALVKKTAKYLSSEYPAPIHALAEKVLEGTEEASSLVGAATMWESMKEGEKAKAAEGETEEAGETPAAAAPVAEGAATGDIATEADLAAVLEMDKKRHGIQ